MDQNNIIECGGFYFIHNFDSGNLGHVERVPTELIAPSVNPKTNTTETPDYEFNLWTRPDCAGTEFENGNRTWFYFGVQASEVGVLVRLNLINLNKQGKMYNQGMAPVTRTLPGKPQWERIRDRPVHSTDDNTFTLSFKYRTSDNLKATSFFAFTYPFSFAELQIALNSIDLRMLPLPPPQSPDDIYYCRECLIYTLEGRRVDLLTISSYHGISTEREDKLKNLFPDNQERPFKFPSKKVIFISARVHPGETPSSFVFNGFLNLLLTRNDPIAVQLRKLYVFKMVPFLNPDGVARGHYRTDTRGVNLNRVYLNPSLAYHPTVFAARALIRYYHFGCEKEDNYDDNKSYASRSIQNINESVELLETKNKKGTNTSSYKANDYYNKREKSTKQLTGNKSSTNIKQPPDTKNSTKESKIISGETAHLAEQVYEMKLQEKPSQTSDTSSTKPSDTNVAESRSLLNDNTLRTCLGSNVHLTASEELNLQGSNPLRPLRDTLKNSISLLMESTNASIIGDSSMGGTDSRLSNVKMGWCQECRQAIAKLEDSMPGITNIVPGYSASLIRTENPTYRNIDEYRDHQRRQFNQRERKLIDTESADNDETVYFCTNCFKRYVITELNEEIKVCETTSRTSVAVSAGDSADVSCDTRLDMPADMRAERDLRDRLAGSTGDAVPSQIPPKDDHAKLQLGKQKKKSIAPSTPAVDRAPPPKEPESGLFLYVDLHGHASKKGIFMYGNHFEELESCVECMLLPRIMSLNNLHFHFSSCNFTEKNMYLKDRRDGMSREGSGRVAVLKATGLVRSYTLECNYNTGRLVNVLPPTVREGGPAPPAQQQATAVPPKYTPHIFEEVGRSLGASILDLTGQHPNSRIPCSEHRNLSAVREWLRAHTRAIRPQLTMSRLRPKTTSPSRVPLYTRSKGKATDERKENTYVAAKTDTERKRSPPVLAPRPSHDIISMNVKYIKKNEPVKAASKTRYLAENEPKPKTMATAKRRSILAIRKPNSGKPQSGAAGGVVKAKANRRPAEELSKRTFARSIRCARCKPPPLPASSSSDDMLGGNWEEVAGAHLVAGKRRSFPNPSPSRLKKIRLKSGL